MMTAIRTYKQSIQNILWAVSGLLCLVIAIVCWIASAKNKVIEHGAVESEVELHIPPEKVATAQHLGTFFNEVKPLEKVQRVAANHDHGPQFRGSKFLDENKNNYVIELFRVVEEDVIKIFFQRQAQLGDVKNFVYLRLSHEKYPEHFAALYGVYKTEEQAKIALSSLDLALIHLIEPKVVALQDYREYVNDMGADEMSQTRQLREVRLNPVALPRLDHVMMQEIRRQQLASRSP